MSAFSTLYAKNQKSINGTHNPLCTVHVPVDFLQTLSSCPNHLHFPKRSATSPEKEARRSPVAMTSRSPPPPAATPTTSRRSWGLCRLSRGASAPMRPSRGRPGICPTSSKSLVIFFHDLCSRLTRFTRIRILNFFSADEVRYLTSILDFFIIDQAEFWCSRILPWAQTDQIHFKWNIWKFDRTIADIEPHQGVPRLVTSSRESRSSSLIRRGLAFMIE